MDICRICDTESEFKSYFAKEMMFGLKDTFRYFKCSECGCLQISEFPQKMSQYYKGHYVGHQSFASNIIVKLIKKYRVKYALTNRGVFGKIVYDRFPELAARSLYPLSISKNSRILDIGCGIGSLIYFLNELGFNNVLGIDSHIKKDILHDNGSNILRKDIVSFHSDLKWDIVMLHHSLEHMPDQLKVFKIINNLLNENGICIIRIPLVDSQAWQEYEKNWVQMDAPRHFYLHNKNSLSILCKKAGLNIFDTTFDSTSFQFWGSEQYKKGIPLLPPNSTNVKPSKDIFSKEAMHSFDVLAKKLNQEYKGDQAVFYVRKICK